MAEGVGFETTCNKYRRQSTEGDSPKKPPKRLWSALTLDYQRFTDRFKTKRKRVDSLLLLLVPERVWINIEPA